MKTTLTTLLILFAMVAFGQTKIGNITLPDNEAKEYLLDCYNRPDTIKKRTEGDYGIKWRDGVSFYTSEIKAAQSKANDFNFEMSKLAIEVTPNGYIVPRKPSELDYIKYIISKQQ